jgi:4-hydroxy-2-oxoheptanedioate aldolase
VAQFGIFIELASPESVEMAGWAGWDHCVIDCEHAPIDNAMLSTMLRAARIPAYVRVPNSNPESIQGALDNGADGVIVPRLQTADEARRVVEAARFFPHGKRGVNHMVRAAKYSLEPVDEYLEKAAQRTRVIVQIETASALDDVESIAATPGINELFIGPYDLSQALEIPGQVLDEKLLAAGRRVVDAVRANGIALSVFVNNDAAARVWLDMGAHSLHYSADTFLLAQVLRQTRERLRTL